MDKLLNSSFAKFILSFFGKKGKQFNNRIQGFENKERLENQGKVAMSTYIQQGDEGPLSRFKEVNIAIQNDNINQVLGMVDKSIVDLDGKLKNLDQDWLLYYLDKIRIISSNDMQLIWAKLLENKINNYDSVSLRLLDILSTTSVSVVETFKKLFSYVFSSGSDGIIFKTKIDNNELELKYNDILILRQNRFISEGDMIDIPINDNDTLMSITKLEPLNTMGVIITKSIPFKIPVYSLTPEGIMFFNILKNELKITPEIDHEYLANFIDTYCK